MAKRSNERVRKPLLEFVRIDEKPPKVLAKFVRRIEGSGISIQPSSRRVFSADGTSRMVHSADAGSPSFGKDLEHIFRLNVARARRDNKRIVGVADLAPRKR